MSKDYLKITVGEFEIETTDPDEIPVSLSYNLEDSSEFQKKMSGEAFDIKTPATNKNSIAANTFHNPTIEDLTDGTIYRKYQTASIEANGAQIFTGKGILMKSTGLKNMPSSFTWNLHGDNADWLIDLKETTLYDLLKAISFVFSKDVIEASWLFDGSSEALPYVFAPVRYRGPFADYITIVDADGASTSRADNSYIKPRYMRPSMSKYWILYWGFKSVGYTLSSDFFNTDYYRRMVMPWTWGNFLDSDGTRLDAHKFLAKSVKENYRVDGTNSAQSFLWDLQVSNDSTLGAFDANDDYSYSSITKRMKWEYKPPYFGTLEATFSMQMFYNARDNGSNSYVKVRVFWVKNDNPVAYQTDVIVDIGGTFAGGNSDTDIKEIFSTVTVDPGDVIEAEVYVDIFSSKLGFAVIEASVLQFQLDYFKIPLGGTIDFQNYTGLKKYKFLDFLAGECDLHDLSFNTDAFNKKVAIEPTHEYSLSNDLSQKSGGYFVNDFLDWNNKIDLLKEWEAELFSDGEREQSFKFKDDTNDGILKVIQDRNITIAGQGKYVLPERFKAGVKERTNRFFGATMHYDVDDFKGYGTGTNLGISPQLVCLVPENISNTSNSESSNTFLPKSAYYKGLITGVGAWKWDDTVRQDLPFMFAVNYKIGGHDDPILSYSDEKIPTAEGFTIGYGLLKRYFWQRLAIMRNGQWYNVYFRLNNVDVANHMHREFKIMWGHKWELININGYKPMKTESTQCHLHKWVPIESIDNDNTFPAAATIIDGVTPDTDSLDMKYAQLKCLITDIPSS